MSESADLLVVGAGVVGLAVARELATRFPDQRVVVLEKESRLAAHGSGRNSGVLHAGFYYTPDSLKARLTRDGNAAMQQFCVEHGLGLARVGKVVVATSAAELTVLDELYRRGQANGVELEMVDADELRTLEPLARTHERAIFSPNTASVNPVEVVEALAADATRRGVELHLGEEVREVREARASVEVRTARGRWSAGILLNAAGLYADRLAHALGAGMDYALQPFIGLYLYGSSAAPALRRHVYPVPDIRNPFLGVHFTVTVDGHIKIGPTATPALWREQYRWRSFSPSEAAESLRGLARLLLARGSTVRASAPSELAKYSRHLLVAQARKLVPSVEAGQFRTWGHPGVRAQLVDRRTQRLVSDFVVERSSEHAIHILNAASPAFTASLSFARYVVDRFVAEDTGMSHGEGDALHPPPERGE